MLSSFHGNSDKVSRDATLYVRASLFAMTPVDLVHHPCLGSYVDSFGIYFSVPFQALILKSLEVLWTVRSSNYKSEDWKRVLTTGRIGRK